MRLNFFCILGFNSKRIGLSSVFYLLLNYSRFKKSKILEITLTGHEQHGSREWKVLDNDAFQNMGEMQPQHLSVPKAVSSVHSIRDNTQQQGSKGRSMWLKMLLSKQLCPRQKEAKHASRCSLQMMLSGFPLTADCLEIWDKY